MMALTMGSIKLAKTYGAIVGGSGPTHITLIVKAPASTTTSSLTVMIAPIVGVEAPLTVHAIIGTVHERRKRRPAIKMIVGFE